MIWIHVGELMALLPTFNIQTVQGWFEAGGYFILFGLLFACGLGLPLPEDVPLLIAGFFVSQHKMHLGIAAAVAWLGIISGDCMLYQLGRRYGLEVTRLPFVGKHLTRARIEKTEKMFHRYGVWVVAMGRMIAGIRGAMVVAAGATRFRFIKFIIADGLAAIVSGGLFLGFGWFAGHKLGSLEVMQKKIHHFEHYVIGVVLIGIVLIGCWMWWQSRPKHEPPPRSPLKENENTDSKESTTDTPAL